MASWKVNDHGRIVRFDAPDYMTRTQALQYYMQQKQQPAAPQSPGPAAALPQLAPQSPTGQTYPGLGQVGSEFMSGAVHGAVVDPVIGIAQIIERGTGMKIPIPRIQQLLRDYRSGKLDSTSTAGAVGESVGAVGMGALIGALTGGVATPAELDAITPELEQIIPRAAEVVSPTARTEGTVDEIIRSAGGSRAPTPAHVAGLQAVAKALQSEQLPPSVIRRVLQNPLLRRSLIGGATAAMQPTDPKDRDFWGQKAEQVGAGAAAPGAGRVIERGAGAAAQALKHLPWWVRYPAYGFGGYGLEHYGLGHMIPSTLGGLAAGAAATAAKSGAGAGAIGSAIGQGERAVDPLYRQIQQDVNQYGSDPLNLGNGNGRKGS